MPSAAQILAALPEASAVRLASTLAPPGAAVGTGLPEIDALLGGGLPRGRIAEIVGAASAGRTGFVLAIAAAATIRGEVIAWIDLEDALDPSSLEAAGADLARVLWVRPPTALDGLKAADAVLDAGGFGLVVVDFGDSAAVRRRAPGGRESSGRAGRGDRAHGDGFTPPQCATSRGGQAQRRRAGGATAGARGAAPTALNDASWTRLGHRAERSGTTVLVSTPTELAGTHATVALAVARCKAVLAGCPALLESIESRVSLARCRFRPPGAEAELSLVAG